MGRGNIVAAAAAAAAAATAVAVVQIGLSSTNGDFISCIVEFFGRGVRFISSTTSIYPAPPV